MNNGLTTRSRVEYAIPKFVAFHRHEAGAMIRTSALFLELVYASFAAQLDDVYHLVRYSRIIQYPEHIKISIFVDQSCDNFGYLTAALLLGGQPACSLMA